MNQTFLQGAVFLFILLSAIGTNGQTKTAATSKSPARTLSKKNFTARDKTFGEQIGAVNRPFDHPAVAETKPETTDILPPRQQKYVRPTKEERRRRYLSNAFGVPALIGAGIGATVNQIGNNPPEWRRTAGGFGKRYASSYGTNAIEYTVSYGLSEAFRLDNFYEKSTQKSFGKRLQHVLVASYTTRTKTGKRIVDFPYITGNYASNIIANEVWYPKRFSFQDGVRDGTYSLGARFGVNLLREFLFSK